MGEVVRMIDKGSVPCSDAADIAAWAESWIEAAMRGDFGSVKSLIIVVENDLGEIGAVSQSTAPMDRMRLIGMLTALVHKRLDGQAQIADMG